MTCVFLVPAQWQAVCAVTDVTARQLSLRVMGWGAAPASDTLLRRMAEVFPGVTNVAVFGQTEMSPVTCLLEGRDALRKLGSVGRPVATIAVRVVDAKMRDVAPGGDDGFVHVVDRTKDMIITGGENVYCAEVENVLAEHPDVVEAAVIGRPDERWGQTPVAVLVLRPGSSLSLQALATFCREAPGLIQGAAASGGAGRVAAQREWQGSQARAACGARGLRTRRPRRLV